MPRPIAMPPLTLDPNSEWLEPDGLGGFASGTVGGARTRRYHALLLAATAPPSGRMVLVNGLEAWVDTPDGAVALSTQFYAPGVTYPDGAARITGFADSPWPSWTFTLPDGGTVLHEVFAAPGSGQTCLRWQRDGAGPCRLRVRLLLSGRDYHALHHENPAFRFDAEPLTGGLAWAPYPDVPPIAAWGGAFTPDATWYRRFLYTAERDRGLDDTEDLASAGTLAWDLTAGPAELALRADTQPAQPIAALRRAEAVRRGALPGRRRAVDAYIVPRGAGQTVIAGYPWFTDWGRDTFIALRGLLLATGRFDAARAILLGWAGLVDQGMLPNRFPDGSGPPEFNAVDASLWFIVAAHELMQAAPLPAADAVLRAACTEILDGYCAGTRFGIGRDDADGLLRAGAPGVQLTWMDATVGDWVVTPRRGKPVEIQALWINALAIAADWDARWAPLEAQARAAFLARFPDPRDRRSGRRGGRGRGARRGGPQRAAQPGVRRGRPSVRQRATRPRRRHRGASGGAAADTARPAYAGAGGPRLPAPLRRRRAGAGRRLPPGHRLAVAARSLRGSLAARPWRPCRRRRALPAAAARPPGHGRAGARVGGRGWRLAAHAGRLPLPSVVDGGDGADRSHGGAARVTKPSTPKTSILDTAEGPPGPGRQPRRGLAPLGPICQRPAVGHGAGGLQPRRHRLGLPAARPRPQPRLSLGRGRDRRLRRRQAALVPGDRAMERAGPHPEGAPVRPDQQPRATTART